MRTVDFFAALQKIRYINAMLKAEVKSDEQHVPCDSPHVV